MCSRVTWGLGTGRDMAGKSGDQNNTNETMEAKLNIRHEGQGTDKRLVTTLEIKLDTTQAQGSQEHREPGSQNINNH